MKNSEIILCSGIKLDRNYENVLSYSESDMVNLCRNNSIYTGNTYNILQPNIIRISASYSSCIYANYMAFINPRYGNKWIFAWVTNVKLINPSTTEITFQTDVFSTWYSRFNLNQSFIEREHVTDDVAGNHTIPEGLETGEFIINNIIKQRALTKDNSCYIIASTYDCYTYYDNGTPKINKVKVGGGVYNGVATGLRYYFYDNTTDGRAMLLDTIRAFAESGVADGIVSIFIAPFLGWQKHYYGESNCYGYVIDSNYSFNMTWDSYDTPSIYKPSSIDGYTPVNKKLLTFPYCYMTMNNGNGGNALFKYELFKNPDYPTLCDFVINTVITPGMSINLKPQYYKYNGDASPVHSEALVGGKFPMCGWVTDSYTNWLTQNAVNIKLGIIANSAQVGLGTFEMGAFPGQGSQNILSGLAGIAGSMKDIYLNREYMSPQSEGNINSGDVTFSTSNTTFTCYKMSIKQEFARSIDQYFSRFGYKVNSVKTPNLNSRQVFNYIKVGGMDELVSGNIPSTDLEEINSIFRKGTTIFHNYNNIGNYTISNPNA